MPNIRLYNTIAREKQDFEPIDPNNIRMYVCGPTVYDYAHIGNARPVVVFDMLYRLLREIYGKSKVTYARNFTDIDDKIMERAARDNVKIEDITKQFAEIYEEDMSELGALTPSIQPRATDHLPEMIKMVKTLIKKGNAYKVDGHVLFQVSTMDNYGRLSGHSRDDLVAGARVNVADYKRDPADFVLWKPSSDDQPGWDSPWGRGRPGWHLECSCMTEKHLGKTIDIHGGGQDLIFPHHENEIAQSECAHGQVFANFWMHNGYLTVDGEKMSKSLGNFHTVHDLLAEGLSGEALRLSLLTGHYRQPIDFSKSAVAEQYKRIGRWYRITDGVTPSSEVPPTVIDALCDDLNTPKAVAALEELATPEGAAGLLAGARFLGLLQSSAQAWFQGTSDGDLSARIEGLIERRALAKAEKDWPAADAVRDELQDLGVVLEDGPGGTTWRKADVVK